MRDHTAAPHPSSDGGSGPGAAGDPDPGLLQQQVFQFVSDAILVYDNRGRIVDANRQAAALLACPQRELVTMNLDNFQMTPAPPFPEDAVRWEGTLRTVDGITLPVDISRARLPAPNEGLSVLVLRDISAHVAIIKEYERLIADLDDFAHIVAHDLQNPLNTIMHSIDMMQDETITYTPDLQAKIIKVAERSTRKAINIIEELLLLAGVRQEQPVTLSLIDMGVVVRGALDRLAYMVEDYHARIALPETWPAAQGYAPWVEEVWTNYISNAIKYGGQPPAVQLGGEVQPDGMVRFWVRDNGLGVKVEEQHRLFVPFSRLERVRARGYGLGLSIVERIVSRLGGTVGFANLPEGGAEFSFTLPATSDSDGSPA
ncbi:MAG: hypothetical protein Kow0077_31320 [Anaerolineae bacterium]